MPDRRASSRRDMASPRRVSRRRLPSSSRKPASVVAATPCGFAARLLEPTEAAASLGLKSTSVTSAIVNGTTARRIDGDQVPVEIRNRLSRPPGRRGVIKHALQWYRRLRSAAPDHLTENGA